MPSRKWFISEDPAKKNPVEGGPAGPEALAFRDAAIVNSGGSVNDITLTTPSGTVNGDFMLAVICVHSAQTNQGVFADDPTNGWEFLAYTKNFEGADHQYSVFWKLADGGDVGGAASYQFNNRTASNLSNSADVTDGFIAAFSGVQDPASDLDFLYGWDINRLSGLGDDALFGDIDFDDDIASEGDGLLVCFVANDINTNTITTPAEMDEHINDANGAHTMVLATETISPSTGSVGPKRFAQSASTDFVGFALILKPRATDGRFESIYAYPKLLPGFTRTTFTAGGSVVFTVPDTTEEGDLLVAILCRDGSASGSVSAVTQDLTTQGWKTALYDANYASDTAIGIWWKIATAEDATTEPDLLKLDWSGDSNEPGIVRVFRFGNVSFDTADSFIGFLGNTQTTSGTVKIEPTVVTPFDNCLLLKVFVGGSGTNSRKRDTSPGGMGHIIDISHEGASSDVSTMIMIQGAPFAGAYGNGQFIQDTSQEADIATIYIALVGA